MPCARPRTHKSHRLRRDQHYCKYLTSSTRRRPPRAAVGYPPRLRPASAVTTRAGSLLHHICPGDTVVVRLARVLDPVPDQCGDVPGTGSFGGCRHGARVGGRSTQALRVMIGLRSLSGRCSGGSRKVGIT